MAKNREPKFKQSRREGVNITGTTSARLGQVLSVPPGGRQQRRRRSEYGLQLRAKQRVKGQYGMLEGPFRRLLRMAERMPGPSGLNLLQILERRLDNVIYRAGLARTRPMARQMVSHKHVLVNGRPVNIPSYLVEPGDRVELRPAAADIPTVKEEMANRPATVSWLRREGTAVQVAGLPRREDIEPDIREDLVFEYYAR